MIDGGLRILFRKHLPQFFWTSVESGETGQGKSDSNYLHDGGIEGWVEYKETETYRVAEKLSWKFQVAWIHRRALMGGRAVVAVRRRHAGGPRRGPAVDELYVVAGAHARQLRAGGLLETSHWRTAGGPALWDWPAVARLLLAAPVWAKTGPGTAPEDHGGASAGRRAGKGRPSPRKVSR